MIKYAIIKNILYFCSSAVAIHCILNYRRVIKFTGNLYKANEAYSQAQRAEPSYVNSWIGQALIAEIMNRKETVDLFRHARQLGYHSQAAIGYTHWVFDMILKPNTKYDLLCTNTTQCMHSISSAADVMTWYVGKFLSLFIQYIL